MALPSFSTPVASASRPAAAATDLGSGTVSTRGDVSNLADLDRFYAEIGQTFGGLDVLVVDRRAEHLSKLIEREARGNPERTIRK